MTRCLPVVFYLILAVAPVARADLRLNDDARSAEQNQPAVAVRPGLGAVATWIDQRSGENDIFFQAVDTLGQRIGDNLGVVDDTIGAYQSSPDIAVAPDGTIWIAWVDYREGAFPFGPEIYTQQYAADLSPLGSNTRITNSANGNLKADPSVAISPDGRPLFVWAEFSSGNWSLRGQRLSLTGTPIGTPFAIEDDPLNAQQHAPSVAIAPSGHWLVAWYDNRLGNDDIFCQRFDAADNPLGGNVRVNGDASGARQAFPSVATDAIGSFAITWVDWQNGTYPTNPDIYVRTFDSSGFPVTLETRLTSDQDDRAQREVAIATDRWGNAGTVWSDSTDVGWVVTGQMVDADGLVRETSFRVDGADSAEIRPDIALDGQRRYVVWVDRRNGDWDCFAQVTVYNELQLVARPEVLSFTMIAGEPLPLPQSVTIEDVGYNRLPYTVSVSESWLRVEPSSGITPGSLTVSVTQSDLAVGTYAATVDVSADGLDSIAGRVSVSLRVDTPVPTAEDDSFLVLSQTLPADNAVPLNVVAVISAPLVAGRIPLRADSGLTIDSLALATGWSGEVRQTGDPSLVELAFAPNGIMSDTGQISLGQLWVSTQSVSMETTISPARIDNQGPRFVRVSGDSVAPIVPDAVFPISSPTDVDEPFGVLPVGFGLGQNYPNPFNPTTTIPFTVGATSAVRLEIFNILGRQVATIVDQRMSAGEYRIVWDGRSHDGTTAASGVYFYRLAVADYRAVRRMVLIR